MVAFPNGTFANIALVEADVAYQALMIQKLHNALDNQDYGLIHPDEQRRDAESNNGRVIDLRQVISSAQRLLGLRTSKPTSNTSNLTSPELPGLRSLIKALKTSTEEYLENAITNVTVTFPGLFNSTQKFLLHQALEEANLHSIACFDAESSANAAALAYRHAQFHSNNPNVSSTTECIFGPFGAEEVISVDYTGSVLTLHTFELFVGKQISFQKYTKHFAALRNSTGSSLSNIDVTEDQAHLFWENVTSNIRTFIMRSRTLPQRVLRLVLTGSASHDLDLLNTLQSAIGELLPSSNNPCAARVVLCEEELEQNYQDYLRRREGLTCLYTDPSWEWTIKAYENDLLALVDPPIDHNEGRNIDARFAAARGAALLGLASRVLPCEQRKEILDCYWCAFEDDNKRKYFPGWEEHMDEV